MEAKGTRRQAAAAKARALRPLLRPWPTPLAALSAQTTRSRRRSPLQSALGPPGLLRREAQGLGALRRAARCCTATAIATRS